LRRTDEKPRRSVTLVEVKASRITKIAGLSLAGFVAGNKAAFGVDASGNRFQRLR